MTLYHYTCARNAALIAGAGVLLPHPQPLFDGLALVWLTDLGRYSTLLEGRLALTWHTTRLKCAQQSPPCDPTAFRFPVAPGDEELCIPFTQLLRAYPETEPIYRRLPAAHLHRWFVSKQPLPVNPPSTRKDDAWLTTSLPSR